MKTDALIDLLATGAGPTQRHPVARRFGAAITFGAVCGFAILLLTLGINPALRDFLLLPAFWIKMIFAAALTLCGFVASVRLARPGVAVGNAKWFAAATVAALWVLALVVFADAEPGVRAQLVLGNSWSVCPFRIALLSAPTLAASIWAMRGLAPTNPGLAGAASGLFSGALGACIYGLHCPELAPPFLAIWYVIGILIPTIVGLAIGRPLLRW
jgi:hypothetical protein